MGCEDTRLVLALDGGERNVNLDQVEVGVIPMFLIGVVHESAS